MSTVPEIERAIEKLPPDEFNRLREWFAEFDATRWDHKFEADVRAGRLDSFGKEALDDLRNGRCIDL